MHFVNLLIYSKENHREFFTQKRFRNGNIKVVTSQDTLSLTEDSQFIWVSQIFVKFLIKGALKGLRQFLSTGSPLKIMKNAIYFTIKALFVFKIFEFLFSLISHTEKMA